MRKITEQACYAFENGAVYKNGNTFVRDGQMLLHGNVIAEWNSLFNTMNKTINITLAGWNTNTTRERLNGLQGVSIKVKNDKTFLNGKEWDGEWITITR